MNTTLIPLSTSYVQRRQAFFERVATLHSRTVQLVTGRRFDRIERALPVPAGAEPKWQVLFFIDTSTERIFGPRSKTAPNFHWYWGTLSEHTDWNFSPTLIFPTPYDKKKYVIVGGWSNHVYYRKLSDVRATHEDTGITNEHDFRIFKPKREYADFRWERGTFTLEG